MDNEIFEKYKSQENEKIIALINKAGIDVIITPIIQAPQEKSDYDPFFENGDIEIIGNNNRIKEKETFGNEFESKMYILHNTEPITFLDNTIEDNNTTNIIEAYILNNDLEVGSIVKTLYNIQYKIIGIEKNRGIETIKKYKLIKV